MGKGLEMTNNIKIQEGQYTYQIPVEHDGQKYYLHMIIKYWDNDYRISCDELGLHLTALRGKSELIKAALKGVEIMIDRAEKLLELKDTLSEALIDRQQDIDPEFNNIVNEHFDDLIEGEKQGDILSSEEKMLITIVGFTGIYPVITLS